jgi:polyketide biosynthesis acyl carrier protein
MTDDDTRPAVHEAIRRVLPDLGAIDGASHLKDLGADSVDRVEIIQGITGRFGLDVPLVAFSDVPDVDGLIDLVDTLRRTA